MSDRILQKAEDALRPFVTNEKQIAFEVSPHFVTVQKNSR